MANEFITTLNANNVVTGTGAPFVGVVTGYGKGISYAPKVKQSVYKAVRIPAASAVTGGIKFELLVADDALQQQPAGKVSVWGVTVGPIVSGTSTFDEAATGALASSTEGTGNVTSPGTAGVMGTASITLATGNINGAAASQWVLMRVRRLGDSPAETNTGRVILLEADVRAG